MKNMDESFDFVVVGSGGGSMCAALFMRSRNKSVAVLEKTDLVGGCTSRSGGVMWIPNNRFMARDGVHDSEEQAMAYLDAVVGEANTLPGATRERRLAYVTQAPAMVDFLVDQGICLTRADYWPDYYNDMPGGSEAGRTVIAELFNTSELGEWKKKLRPTFLALQASMKEAGEISTFKYTSRGKLALVKVMLRTAWAKLAGQHWVSCGAALQGRMLQASLQAGVDIRTEAGVKELLVEDGRVVGVVIARDGRDWCIGARLGVLINAGGFAHNQAMRDQYLPGSSTAWTNSPPGDTGEMIEEGQRIGAALAQMSERVGHQIVQPPEHKGLYPMMQTELAKPHTILVDQSGVRYMNEACSYMEFVKNQMARNKTVPAIPSWMILDSRYIDRYLLGASVMTAKKMRAWQDKGFTKSGKTIKDLAAALDINAETLVATVDRYNGFVRNGHDEEFHRGDRAFDRFLGDMSSPLGSLGSIEKAPFYAIPVLPGDIGTFGGIVTDKFARALRDDGSVIAGLYATGNSTASVMGDKYPGAGASVGPSFTWGYVAAIHAANAHN